MAGGVSIHGDSVRKLTVSLTALQTVPRRGMMLAQGTAGDVTPHAQ